MSRAGRVCVLILTVNKNTIFRSLKNSGKTSSYFSLNAARKPPNQGVIVRLRGVSRQLALGSRRLARPRSIEKAHMSPAKQR